VLEGDVFMCLGGEGYVRVWGRGICVRVTARMGELLK
jgi:hypothetical protein